MNEGAYVNKAANDGDLSVHAASRRGHLEIIKYLITKGAHIEAYNNYGWTVLHFVTDNGELESLEYFLRNNTSGTSGNSLTASEVGPQVGYSIQPAFN